MSGMTSIGSTSLFKWLNKVSPCSNDKKWTPLDFASDRGHLEVCEILLANDAPINAADINDVCTACLGGLAYAWVS
jgi:ankyrin repeat protein